MRHAAKLATLTVTSAGNVSEVLTLEQLRFFDELQVHSPDTIDSTIEVHVREPGDTDWDDFHGTGGSVITVPPGAVTQFECPNGMEMRLAATGSELADRDYEVYGIDQLR